LYISFLLKLIISLIKMILNNKDTNSKKVKTNINHLKQI